MIKSTTRQRGEVGGAWHVIFRESMVVLLGLKRLSRFIFTLLFGFSFHYYLVLFFVCLSVLSIWFRLWMTKSAKKGGIFGIGNSLSGREVNGGSTSSGFIWGLRIKGKNWWGAISSFYFIFVFCVCSPPVCSPLFGFDLGLKFEGHFSGLFSSIC